ncbi:hypothetical protein LOZ58_001444 [Ophidiomyces ophidiicola]|nr:hypothetical protein LOZ65_003880 [Ophidiomyces ophidiicola]KAI1942568.1 hypothetical protein LOZ66_000973 [Ophidiomyces ophidiicola]KAI1964754.1 hypothetical protein LOZ58_001444 [Ophidiomyces ophidiicola]
MNPTIENKPPVICVFCGAKPGNNPAYLEAARAFGHELHKNNATLVYGGGTSGLMGEVSRTLVSLSGPHAVHGIIPEALVKVESGHKAILESEDGVESEEFVGKAPERIVPANSSTEKVNSEYGLTTIVSDMHTRKRMMADKVIAGGPGSGFVVLPGGFGTLEEAMEMITWNQLGIHSVGIVLLNIDGYWDGILDWVKESVKETFVTQENSKIMVECKDVKGVLRALKEYRVSEERYNLQWGKKP